MITGGPGSGSEAEEKFAWLEGCAAADPVARGGLGFELAAARGDATPSRGGRTDQSEPFALFL